MLVDSRLYRKAFQAYLRNGTPIEWSIKQERPTTQYIWRTQGDANVRPSHTANDGHIFAWDNPPPTGHPGEDFGCRCTAEPYEPAFKENIAITMSDVSDGSVVWSSGDFIHHYYHGGGLGVTVRETGHLSQIIAQYRQLAEEKLKDQIASRARESQNGTFARDFNNSYPMTGIVFSIGDTKIGGLFHGSATEALGMLTISGEIEFYLRDAFADPADLGELQRRLGIDDAQDVEIIDPGETIFENIQRPFEDYLRGRAGLPASGPQRLGIHLGDPYSITDDWSGHFEGQVYTDPKKSAYVRQEG